MDISSLEGDVQRYFENGLAPSTRRTYQAGINNFVKFCGLYNISNPLPVSQSVLCSYISHLANSGLAYGTIRTYLAAIRYLQISRDLPEPRAEPMPKLALVQRGIQRLKPQSASKPRLPITPAILRQLKALWTGQATDFNIIMLWAACCTAFFGFFRMGELTSPTVTSQGPVDCVSVGDVAVDDHNNPSLVRIHLHKSKTDQLGKGVDIYLGRTDCHEVTCPP